MNLSISRKPPSKDNILSNSFKINDKEYKTYSEEFANLLNNHFSVIGTKMANQIPPSDILTQTILKLRVFHQWF